MPLSDYFSAADDRAAIAVLQTRGGPEKAGLDVVLLENIDPVVAMARLEVAMTGCSYEEARELPRSGEQLSSPEGESLVVSVSDSLAGALAAASRDDLVRSAELWSMTDELREEGISVEVTVEILEELAGLAHRALASRMLLYCWLAL
ncbi:hypothetical protein [Streptomyces fuscichromogenes]|uniref:Uncharacterized protein n=1 Tax=Streptomyces fuscichromogenes TaxID=1324013 RepID=A0A917XPA4_9ACTN|nr:hypothetical protein [Streptomyces fuscichromogenes]GGN46145.1 hypothetical protein GCM10011578_098760 [Streptomyces fuscichromogenes]